MENDDNLPRMLHADQKQPSWVIGPLFFLKTIDPWPTKVCMLIYTYIPENISYIYRFKARGLSRSALSISTVGKQAGRQTVFLMFFAPFLLVAKA